MAHELGVWNTASGDQLPDEAMWMVSGFPVFTPPTDPSVKVIVQHYRLPREEGRVHPFDTVAWMTHLEDGLKAINLTGAWGLILIAEEVYRSYIAFVDDMDMLWFGERLVGYPIYASENPGATRDEWLDEMWLRMCRGFHDYFSPMVKVGVVCNSASVILGHRDRPWNKGIPQYWGYPALNYIRDNYDFVILSASSHNLDDFLAWTKPYFSDIVDVYFSGPRMTRLLVITQDWGGNYVWEWEVMAPEMKNCLDRNIVVLKYKSPANPPLEAVWPLMLHARELYAAKVPYTESVVYDENLLLDYVGDTYGWVANPGHDEGLYPSGILSFGKIALIAGAYYLLKRG